MPEPARNVTVNNNDGSATVTLNAGFTVNAAPTVSASASPSSRGQGASNQNLTITGSDFVSGGGGVVLGYRDHGELDHVQLVDLADRQRVDRVGRHRW